MKNICVFLGANQGSGITFTDAVKNLGQLLVENELRLIYGGASVGLMGMLANQVLSCGGEVKGVIPEVLMKQEIVHKSLTKLYKVRTMQERKKLMVDLSDAFIVFPGGIGTLEELFEVWSAIKLAQIHKPLGILNIDGYYDGLLNFIDQAIERGLITHDQRNLISVSREPQSLLHKMVGALGINPSVVQKK